MKEANEVHKPLYFELENKIDKLSGKKETHYNFIKGQKSYWQRRETFDWKDCPDLF